MPYKEKKVEKLYYSIGEVAEMFNVNASLIRFWEKEFDIIKPKKNKKGNRFFTMQDIDNIQLIYHLVKERGLTLNGAKKKLRDNREDTNNNYEVVKIINPNQGHAAGDQGFVVAEHPCRCLKLWAYACACTQAGSNKCMFAIRINRSNETFGNYIGI